LQLGTVREPPRPAHGFGKRGPKRNEPNGLYDTVAAQVEVTGGRTMGAMGMKGAGVRGNHPQAEAVPAKMLVAKTTELSCILMEQGRDFSGRSLGIHLVRQL